VHAVILKNIGVSRRIPKMGDEGVLKVRKTRR
jgi:hypothetical protein